MRVRRPFNSVIFTSIIDIIHNFGFFFVPSLSLNVHIDKITCKASLGSIKQIKHELNTN